MNSQINWMSGVMLLAGFGIPVMAALNGALGLRIGASGAAAVLFAVGFSCACAAAFVSGGVDISTLSGSSPLLFAGGLLVAFYVLSITMLGPRMGIGTAVLFVLMGQLVSAGIIDHFGLLGAPRTPMSSARWLGFGLMAIGVWLAKR